MPRSFEQESALVLQEAHDLLIHKHKAYGARNIQTHGIPGVLVRISDKLARLEHAYEPGFGHTTGSADDNWLDLLNYALIGLMLERGTFGAPLEQNMPTFDPSLEELQAHGEQLPLIAPGVMDQLKQAVLDQHQRRVNQQKAWDFLREYGWPVNRPELLRPQVIRQAPPQPYVADLYVDGGGNEYYPSHVS